MRWHIILDKVLLNCKYVTQNNGVWILKNGNIGIHDGIIVDENMIDDVNEIVDMSGKILFPVLFNLHAHLGESIFKNISGNDWNISRYLSYTNEFIKKQCREEQERKWYESALYTMQQMQQNGIWGFCSARSAPIYELMNMYTMAGYPIMNNEKLKHFQDGGINEFARYYKTFNNEKCSVGIFFHSLYMTDASSLRFAQKCLEHGAEFISIHLSEDEVTREREVKQYGKVPALVLDEYKLLNEKTILTHCGFVSEFELELISQRKSCIAICPLSNKFLNTKVINPTILNQYGIKWSVCTDGLATGRTLSLLDQIKFFKRLYPEISNSELLNSVTVIPASMYGRGHYTGIITKGTAAIFNQINSNEEAIDKILQSFIVDKNKMTIRDFSK